MKWAEAAGKVLPKARRKQLAKAELLLYVAVAVEDWSKSLIEAGTGGGSKRLPSIDEWPKNDPLVALMRTYNLTPVDLAKLCHDLGDRFEGQAMRAGYADHWDDPADD